MGVVDAFASSEQTAGVEHEHVTGEAAELSRAAPTPFASSGPEGSDLRGGSIFTAAAASAAERLDLDRFIVCCAKHGVDADLHRS